MEETMKDVRFRSAYAAGAVTPADVLAFHRATFGRARMDASDDPPEGVSAEEWEALGDPGKKALVRERERATKAEQALAAAAKPAPPKPAPPKQEGKQQEPDHLEAEPPDIAALISEAVKAAIQPLQAEQRAERIRADLLTAATQRLHDPNDALVHIDLSTLTDGAGASDAAKITAALDALAKAKPHLVKPDAHAYFGGGPATAASMDDQVKAALAKMHDAAGIHAPTSA